MKKKLDGYYRDAYQRTYGSHPPEGFITDSVGVMKDLLADEAFDNELCFSGCIHSISNYSNIGGNRRYKSNLRFSI